jgi:hypothetical protein
MHALAPQWLAAAACATAGSSPPSTSTSASSATACRSTPTIPGYDHDAFRPWRVQALAFKAIRRLCIRTIRSGATSPTNTSIGKLAIDVINGGPLLREWVDNAPLQMSNIGQATRRAHISATEALPRSLCCSAWRTWASQADCDTLNHHFTLLRENALQGEV